jgi:hypothetical protein
MHLREMKFSNCCFWAVRQLLVKSRTAHVGPTAADPPVAFQDGSHLQLAIMCNETGESATAVGTRPQWMSDGTKSEIEANSWLWQMGSANSELDIIFISWCTCCQELMSQAAETSRSSISESLQPDPLIFECQESSLFEFAESGSHLVPLFLCYRKIQR